MKNLINFIKVLCCIAFVDKEAAKIFYKMYKEGKCDRGFVNLEQAFVWCSTDQGHAYWSKINRKIRR